ncbi:cupin domain-containing protein [Anaerobacillus isosaccharinicus]|uniref:Cupin n=1 Tax=Anaerobacillus isosaccharinicus TaxID=1532552 RepID=A0A1S2LMK3_9BACI|nr:cupin domain-containing protein [Anaerobacillus isosaccharinicus]MBA5586228.1 cupin domain-containing protein [Anaerobacillus isosaccharinicus]QOY35516.1 cupin domain-containing protein [Anaerobacillus isosaccharinicus]
MYNGHHMYPYPYYTNVNTPMYYADNMPRENQQQVAEALFDGIKREASDIDLYSRLATVAPNQKHKKEILHALDEKKGYLNQFTNLFMTLTGSKPMYEIDNVPFRSYREGLQKAYESGIKGHEEYQKICSLTQYPLVQNVFFDASIGEREYASRFSSLEEDAFKDYGSNPFVVNIEEVTKQNNSFRTALWTGKHLQVTLMSIDVGEDIGLEVHPDLDQFLRIEQGQGRVQMGDRKDNLDFEANVFNDFAIMVPAGKWHNLTNTGNVPLKVYSIYAPPQHPYGTVHETKAIAMADEENHSH